MQCHCRGLEFGRSVTIEALDLVMRSSEVLERFNRVVGGLGSLRVDCEPTGGTIKQYNRYRVRWEVWIFLKDGRARVLNEVVASNLFAKPLRRRVSTLVGDEFRYFLPFRSTLHLSLVANVAVRILWEVGHHVPHRLGFRKRTWTLGAFDTENFVGGVVS